MKTEKNENENENARHTPGPWTVYVDYGYAKIYGPEIKGQDTLPVICKWEYTCNAPAPKGLLDNARLIAAAPELLAALKECLYELDRLTSCSPEDSSAMIQARAAIAKAEGR